MLHMQLDMNKKTPTLLLIILTMLLLILWKCQLPAFATPQDNETGDLPLDHLLLKLIIILGSAKLVGELFKRLDQPEVLGELIAGIIIGPSLLGWVEADHYIKFLAEIGVIILIFEVGLESDLKDLLQTGFSSFLVAALGVIFPFGMGYFTVKLIGIAEGSTEVAIFLGATLTATSVGLTARVLSDSGKLDSNESKVILGAAVIDDVLGLIILATVVGLIQKHTIETGSLLLTAGSAVGFLVGALVIGVYVTPHFMKLIEHMRVRGVIFVTSFLWCLFLAFVAHRIGLATIVGAFAAGLVVEKATPNVCIGDRIKPVANIFVPIFFVTMGMMVDVKSLINPQTLLLAGIIIAVAIISKILCGWGAYRNGMNRLAIGIGMIPRGEVGLIFASYGLTHTIITQSVYSAVILMVLVTTLITPPLLKAIMSQHDY
jgi:Kef-type K+ transport system membrane component KefB